MSGDNKAPARWVIKIGSALLTNNGQGLDLVLMQAWVDQMVALRGQGIEVVVVSSGAVAEGMRRLGWSSRPASVHELQAAAAVGQMGLVQAWESRFQVHGLVTAQVLLTHDDLSDRTRYLNARSTLVTLLGLNVVPVVNENDTVVTDEIRFGDNDTLAALVANLVVADRLVILTDQSGVFERDPRQDPGAPLIREAQASDPRLMEVAGDSGSGLGRGGMITKIRAARLAARSGARTTIASGRSPEVLAALAAGEAPGTTLLPDTSAYNARKQWLAGHLQMRGRLVLDDGAVQRLREAGSSLLPVGVVSAHGQFSRGEMVACEDQQGRRIACGLVNYDHEEAALICRKKSSEIQAILGYMNEEELIHRDNLVIL
ncbi:gamma-glutamyl kinase [Isoalcanivorax pacificus W11-5]|uniref:Glutamate 5-kinase n=1 Tax=Isoalcanivorax pacificus W11-5 TaxID=391936 RepID=A0A0B4XG66_9GAMM|nr:glutamate 5-kinase [Isoalcanivorax pacificus]AJD47059.1 gamma-glutamyl kinase [Isoalcanivorax pacificus W11-5]